MTETPLAAVTYVGLPIGSGGAHSLGRMPRRAAHDLTMSFLETCTEQVRPAEYSFTVHDVPELPRQRDLEAALDRRFGHGRHMIVPADRVGDALDFLDDVHPQPSNQWGMAPVWFTATASFRILDPATGQALPGQDPERFAGQSTNGRFPSVPAACA